MEADDQFLRRSGGALEVHFLDGCRHEPSRSRPLALEVSTR